MNEYQSGDCCDWCNDDVRNRYEGAQQLLRDYKMFLDRPELTAVSWAWFQDPPGAPNRGGGCMGLVDARWQEKGCLQCLEAVRQDASRSQSSSRRGARGDGLADDHRASLLIWNTDAYERRFDVNFKNVPFSRGSIGVYRIDKKHASVGDGATEDLEPVETFKDVETRNGVGAALWLPMRSSIRSDDGSGISELAPVKVARVVRVNRLSIRLVELSLTRISIARPGLPGSAWRMSASRTRRSVSLRSSCRKPFRSRSAWTVSFRESTRTVCSGSAWTISKRYVHQECGFSRHLEQYRSV